MIAWQEVAIIGGTAVAIVGLLAATFVKNDLRVERRLYWGSWLTLGAFATAAVWTKGWDARIGAVSLCLLIATFRAYTSTPYLKFRGKIYAWSRRDAEAETPPQKRKPFDRSDYPGGLAPNRMWWLFTGIAVCSGIWAYAESWYGWPGVLVATCGICGLVFGIDDASRRLPVVRGQHLQAFVILIASIPMFAVPPVAYVLGYHLGRRRPMGRGRHSGN